MRAQVKFLSDGTKQYSVNGKTVSEKEFNKLYPSKKINYEAGELPGLHMDYGDWSQENGGKGRYCPQKASGPMSADGYCRSRGELIEWAKTKDKMVEKD